MGIIHSTTQNLEYSLILAGWQELKAENLGNKSHKKKKKTVVHFESA